MKTKKKILSIFLCLLLIVSILPISVSAANGMEIRVSSAECQPGETITVKVDLINNPGLASLKLKVFFADVLSLQSVEYNTSMGGQTMQPQSMSSPATLMWVSPFADYSSDATFATLTFKVAENATPNTVTNITLSYDPNDIYDMTETNLNCFVTNGKITIGAANSNDDGYISSTEHSTIDFSNQIIFSDSWGETKIKNIVKNIGAVSVKVVPSVDNLIGTGSMVIVDTGKGKVVYDVVVVGDLTGDSVCDVLDAAAAHLYSSGLQNPSYIEIYAANGSVSDDINVNNYQNIVNWCLKEEITLNSAHTVKFVDYDGTLLKTESVNTGDSATPPVAPVRNNYKFVGWDTSINYITEDVTVTAKYVKLDGPAFVVDYVTAQAGLEDVSVNISLVNNPGIASIGMYVDYDSSLTLTQIEYNNSMGGQSIPPQSFASPAKLTWVSPFADATGDAVFATLHFKVSESASGELPIRIRYNENDVYDMTETNINFDVVNNSILITK